MGALNVSRTCEYLTGSVIDDETQCEARGEYFANSRPDGARLAGTTYCEFHTVVLLEGKDAAVFWMNPAETEWMMLPEALLLEAAAV